MVSMFCSITFVMKFFMNMRTIYVVFASCMLACTACNNEPGNTYNNTATHQTAPPPPSRPPVQSKLTEEGTNSLIKTLTAYYQLKDAMVATSVANAKDAATSLTLKAD